MQRRRAVASVAAALLAALGLPRAPWAQAGADRRTERAALLAEIDAMLRATAAQTGVGQLRPGVRRALERVPRERFVPSQWQAHAYENRPLPIGEGQTISQPFIVALMTELLAPEPAHRVLEVGTGSGYQAAVLAECVAHVTTIEIVRVLGEQAARRLAELGYRNVDVHVGDGYQGWPPAAPFDGIMVTAAPDEVPAPLIAQLKPGGRLVVPVGSQRGGQDLQVITKSADGRTLTRSTIGVRFVPLTRELR